MPLRSKSFFSFGSVLALFAALLSYGPATTEAHHPTAANTHRTPHARDFTVTIERPGGSDVASYWHRGAMYVAGERGQRYQIRVTNRTGVRVEAVVTVDGRDVVTGVVGDYRSQRGYVIEPWGNVVIDGFRRSLDHVAAFRFSDIEDSYSSLRGTPQHVGVIGVAVFKERRRARRRSVQPVQPTPGRRYYEPHDDVDRSASGERRSKKAPSSARPSEDGAATNKAAPSRDHARRPRGGYAPPPEPSNELGTEYGETRYSSVREVQFRRHNRRRPDSLLSIYYDSRRGLSARGVPVDPHYWPASYYGPEPFPSARGFVPPPPR